MIQYILHEQQRKLVLSNNQRIATFIDKLGYFDELFKPFGRICKNDKIGKHENKYTIFKNTYIQSLTRWWCNENRRWTGSYIQHDFILFFKLCDDIQQYRLEYMNDTINTILINIIHNVLIGIYNLKFSYINDTDDCTIRLCSRLDSIMYTMIDFKYNIDHKISTLSNRISYNRNTVRNIPPVRTQHSI
jgi:hypothetical protein